MGELGTRSLSVLSTAVFNIMGINIGDLRETGKSSKKNMARGLFYVIARELQFSVTEIAYYTCRSHSATSLVLQKYKFYVQSDKLIIGYYLRIKEEYERLKTVNDNKLQLEQESKLLSLFKKENRTTVRLDCYQEAMIKRISERLHIGKAAIVRFSINSFLEKYEKSQDRIEKYETKL